MVRENRQKSDKKPTKPDIKNFQTLKTDKTRHQFWCVGAHPSRRAYSQEYQFSECYRKTEANWISGRSL